MNKKRLNLLISFIVGLVILSWIVWYFGTESLLLIYKNVHSIYFIPYLFFTTIGFFANALRLKVILNAYKKKVPLLSLLRQNIAGYAVSYVTPTVRIGGEPLKIYMMKKESGVNVRTGTSSIIIDKFIEFFGSALVGVLGLVLLFSLKKATLALKATLAILILVAFAVLFFVYYFTIKGKGPFTNLFSLLKFYRFSKLKKLNSLVKDVEKKMMKFFIHHKKEFFLSLFIYALYGLATFLEIKFLLLAIGVNISVIEAILAMVVIGVVNFIPVPAGLGFHEASQSGLFVLLKGSGAIGLVFSLIERARSLVFVAIGFSFTANFGIREFISKK